MDTLDYQYHVYFEDCSGEIGGTAFIDDCYHCVGGNTGDSICISRVQFFSACDYDGTVEDFTVDGNNLHYINTTSISNASASIKVNSDKEAAYHVGIVYSHAQAGEKLNIFVNEELTNELSLDAGEDWNTIYFDLPLHEGYNKIEFQSQSAAGGIHLESFTYYTSGFSKISCKISSNKTDYSEAIHVYPNPFDRFIFINSEQEYNYKVFNLQGIKVLEGLGKSTINIGDNLASGVYLFQIISDSDIITQRIEKR
jgi:hypothetical protein